MKFILAKKLDMSHRYNAAGQYVPVTAVQAGPCLVLQTRTKDTDGYQAVQVAFGKVRKTTMSEAGHQGTFAKPGEYWRSLKEFRVEDSSKFKKGDMIKVDAFQPGDTVQVVGISKGRGFAGVVKRHHFRGHGTTHGHKDAERAPGSIGAGGHQHVDKGRRMGGRMGNDRVTVHNLKIVEIDAVNNLLFISGPLPGARNSLLMISGPGDMKMESVVKTESANVAPVAAKETVKV